jgi:IS30 family transposase
LRVSCDKSKKTGGKILPCQKNHLLLYCYEKQTTNQGTKVSNPIVIASGYPKKTIAELVGTSMSSVYREINRNKGKRGYTAASAQELCEIRKERYRGKRKFTPAMERHIRDRLTEKQWSPQQIVGEAALHDIPMVSNERIFVFIRQDKTFGG